MSDVREPFNLTEDSSRDAELLAVGSGEHALGEYSVHVEGPGGASGLASVQADGSFSFTRRNISGSEVIGAQHEGSDAFRVWYCPVRNPGAAKQTRQLRQSGVYHCHSITEARAFVHAVRLRAAPRVAERPRAVVIILNPVSGRGTAKKLFEGTVRKTLDAAGVAYTLHITQRAGNAGDIAAALDLASCDALLFMGGDGTVHEALQGLLGRPDWQEAAKMPLAQLPAGSANALAANTGMWDLATALHAVIKKKREAPMDVFSVLQPPHARRYAFLSITFGFIANLDIGTEHLRWMGAMRFTLGAIYEILTKRSHRCRMAYLPASRATVDAAQQAQPQPLAPGELRQDSGSSARDGVAPRQHSSGSAGRAAVDGGPPTPLLDDLFREASAWTEGRLPEGWLQHSSEEVTLFAACALPYLDMTYHIAPRSGLTTGCLDVISTGKATRFEGLQFMIKSENGNHLDLPILDYRQVTALAMEPISSDTWMVVDGEKVPYTRLYAQVHPGLCRVLVA